MSAQQKFSLLRKVLKTLGLSENRIDELIARIQEWMLDDQAEKADAPQYPYHLRDDFLSPAELNFYQVLDTAVSDWATIFTKVSLGDLFFAQTSNRGQNQAYRNKIDRKHVDFLLCDPQTVKPILGIELDDNSHKRPDRQERDTFVDGVFVAAGLPIVHIPVQRSYPTEKLNHLLQSHALGNQNAAPKPALADANAESTVPTCPKCGAKMRLRTAKSGANEGNQFWGCSNYPRCRSILPFETAL